MPLVAKEHCCEEAAILPAGFVDAYIPCDKPAEVVVGWPHRPNEPDVRMCACCADHNVRNRGAVEIGPYDPTAGGPGPKV